jgi:2-polyprenyl-3-methyl-5-hydroxy-6-metoxy-1,4-benzoquinol methylase
LTWDGAFLIIYQTALRLHQELPILSSTATQHTFGFIKEFVTRENAKILEVGCGKGDLAAELGNYGYKVTAIDKSPECVEAAKAKGVQALTSDILEFHCEEAFDAVLFSRSLHHIPSLETVLNKVKKLLNDNGRILIDDFAIEQMDAKTASWFYEMNDLFAIIAGKTSEPENEPKNVIDPLERWKKAHEHEPPIHSRKEILSVMERNFGNIHSSSVPYLYRYFLESAETLPNGAKAVQKVFEWETKLIERSLLAPIGFRIVSKKYFSYLK